MTLDRAPVLAEVEARVANQHLRRHMLATEAIMRALAVRLGEDADVWGLAGLGHDLDAEETESDVTRHGAVAAATLGALGMPAREVSTRSPRTTQPRVWRRRSAWTSASSPPTS